MRQALIGLLATGLLALAMLLTAAGPGGAESPSPAPKLWAAKYGLQDLPKKDRARFWDAVDDLAILDVLIEICENRRARYDRRLLSKVKSCVDRASVNKVQAYFNRRRAHYTRTATPYACKNAKIMRSMNKFRSAVDQGLVKLGRACSLCFFC